VVKGLTAVGVSKLCWKKR